MLDYNLKLDERKVKICSFGGAFFAQFAKAGKRHSKV
jgi:hypothetical protein